jgi:hypothetical protein
MLKQLPRTTASLTGTSSLARLPAPDEAFRAESSKRIEMKRQAWLASQSKSESLPTQNEPSSTALDDVNRPETEADGIRAGALRRLKASLAWRARRAPTQES